MNEIIIFLIVITIILNFFEFSKLKEELREIKTAQIKQGAQLTGLEIESAIKIINENKGEKNA